MADRLWNPVTQVITAGTTYTITHGLTAAGVPVVPDSVSVEFVALTAAATVPIAAIVEGATTAVVTVAIYGAANVGTAVVKPWYLHSVIR